MMEQPYLNRARDYRRMAREALRGVWGIAILISFVAVLLGAQSMIAMPTMRVNFNISNDQTARQVEHLEEQLDELGQQLDDMNPEDAERVGRFMRFSQFMVDYTKQTQPLYDSVLYRAAVTFSSMYALAAFIIGGPIKVGYARFRLKAADRRGPLELKELFKGFDVFGEAFLLQLRITLRVIGWGLLLIVPGIVAAYRYSQAFTILAEHPELKSGDCIERSKAIMNGNKWRLFCLELSFIGWHFLSVLTLGILGLWIAPYEAVAEAFFYRDVTGTRAESSPLYNPATPAYPYGTPNAYDPYQQPRDPRQGW